MKRWLMGGWTASAVLMLLILGWLVALNYQNLTVSREAVQEFHRLNVFFDSTLVVAQRRADSLRAMQRREIDSLRRNRP